MQIMSKNDEKQSVEYCFEDKNRKNLGYKLRSIISINIEMNTWNISCLWESIN